jgi:nucleoside-triphosphatase
MQHTKHIILVTGSPGVGKTTVIMKAAETLKIQGYSVGGMTTQEKREDGNRVGFQILDLATQRQGWLAHVNQPSGPRIGKYKVNLNDLENIGANAIQNATKTAHIIIIDEIGPMELCSETFRQALIEAMESSKPVIATIHHKATDTLVRNIKTRPDTELFEVTMENRNTLHNLIIQKITKILQGNPKC